QAILRFVAPRGQAAVSNSHIFLMWMVGTSVVLLTVAILFLRNQIRPVLRLAEAADAFGKGRPVPPDFRPRGAREVRQAAQAFMEMRDRIRHHVEQRTNMLAGVSHDLRTVLTRFKLELALLRSGTRGGASVHGDARPHPTSRRAAHQHAGGRQPRFENRADPLQARAGAAQIGYARRRKRSWRCATASDITSSSAPTCWRASATI